MEVLDQLPSPLALLTDPVSMLILGMYGSLMLWEALFPARTLSKIAYWKVKGLIAFAFFFYLSSYLPMLWDGYLAHLQLLDLTGLGTYGGATVGILIYELGLYFWHRSMHRNSLLWRVFHQMHHSAERTDSFGAFYFSPMDMIGFTYLGSLSLVIVAGFSPAATTLILLGTTFLSIFQHSNISTPSWLGYIIQRPEQRALHHAKGIHAFNYSDVSLFDMLFGTFRNPESYEHEAGFYPGASAMKGKMLRFRGISKKENSLNNDGT